MSEALDYLLQVRPQAMQSYFAFLKEAGRHLDPKTRALISVITKVDNQTEAGFRQYLKRALAEGVSANEILDALLLAFPTLGLTKVVWAVDRLLELELPEFRPEALGAAPAWHNVIAEDDLLPGSTRRVECDGRALIIHVGSDGLSVFDSHCPHQGTDLPETSLAGTRVTCPRHGWSFDLGNGRCVAIGDRPLVACPHRFADGWLLVFW